MKSLYAVVKNNLIVTNIFIGVKDTVSESNNKVIELTRRIGSKPVTINLEFCSDGLYVRPPSYTFKSGSSHCDFIVKEQRWTRKKDVIFGLVKALKKATVWSFIKNKDFFTINENCASFRKKKGLIDNVTSQIRDILTDDKKKTRSELYDLSKRATKLLK